MRLCLQHFIAVIFFILVQDEYFERPRYILNADIMARVTLVVTAARQFTKDLKNYYTFNNILYFCLFTHYNFF